MVDAKDELTANTCANLMKDLRGDAEADAGGCVRTMRMVLPLRLGALHLALHCPTIASFLIPAK
jgi:hypothetical protein